MRPLNRHSRDLAELSCLDGPTEAHLHRPVPQLAQLLDALDRDHLTEPDDRHPVRHALDLWQIVRREEDRPPRRGLFT